MSIILAQTLRPNKGRAGAGHGGAPAGLAQFIAVMAFSIRTCRAPMPRRKRPDPPTAPPLPAASPAGPAATTPGERSFARRVLIAVGIGIGLSALALFLWYSMYVLLLAFAAVLVGVLLRGSAEWVAARLRIRVGWALGLVILSAVGFFILLGYFAAPSIVQQGEKLADRLPHSLRKAEDTLRQYSWGRRIIGGQPQSSTQAGQAQQSSPARPDASATQPASQPSSQPSRSRRPKPTLMDKVVEAGSGTQACGRPRARDRSFRHCLPVVVLVTGIYLAASPRMYVDGVLSSPHARRPRYREVLNRLAFTLRW